MTCVVVPWGLGHSLRLPPSHRDLEKVLLDRAPTVSALPLSGAGTNSWPLSVDAGTVSCVEFRRHGKRDFAVVFTTEDGAHYALNGSAEHAGRYRPGVEIYLPGVYNPNPSPDATGLIGYGLSLCPHYRPGRW